MLIVVLVVFGGGAAALLYRWLSRVGPRPAGAFSDKFGTAESVAFLGDLQRTSFVERFLCRECNDREQALLLAAIASRASSLSGLYLLGDQVFWGDRWGWQHFDHIMAPIRETRLAVRAIAGNHDYWGWGRASPRAHLFQRFPRLEHSAWHCDRIGRLAVVTLDSNDNQLSRSAWAEQAAWLERRLAELDGDPGCWGAVVLAHHPPFTNSPIVSGARVVRESFLRPFLAARKTLAFVTGHAHGYERFREGGKMCVVSGGGGGPRPGRLRRGARMERTDDLCGCPDDPRPLHFLALTVEDSSRGKAVARFVVVGLDTGDDGVRELDRWEHSMERPLMPDACGTATEANNLTVE